jgi:crotonobetainyl-CoA:carnitine CoA-transferase CaiB-like acyl-CoA transferase
MTEAVVGAAVPGAAGALSNIRVLDLSRVLAGPWCSQNLADLGADVIKVERPGRGDDTRSWGPPWIRDAEGESTPDATYYGSANRGKRSIAVDISTPEGQEVVRTLAEVSDVVIENYKVGDLKRYGLDYDSLKVLNPRLVYCSITGYGQQGPSSHKPGYDFVFQAIGGLMSITGERDDRPGGGPQKAGIALGDIVTGLYSTIAVLAALNHRSVSGVGQYIDMALLDCVVAIGSNQVTGYFSSGKAPVRYGNAHQSLVPYQVFKADDGDLVVAVGNDSQWRNLCDGLERLDLDCDEWSTMTRRVVGRERLVPLLEDAFRVGTVAHWVERLEARGVPIGAINNYEQTFHDPQVVHRGLQLELATADGGSFTTTASPLRLSATPPVYRCAPPTLGDSTDDILAELTSMTPEAIGRLKQKGVLA